MIQNYLYIKNQEDVIHSQMKRNQLTPTFIWSRYRNWQDFKAASKTILSEVRENMNEKWELQ